MATLGGAARLVVVFVAVVACWWTCQWKAASAQSYNSYQDSYNRRIYGSQARPQGASSTPSLPQPFAFAGSQPSRAPLPAGTNNPSFWQKSPLTVENGDLNYTSIRQQFLRQMCSRLLARPDSNSFSFCLSIGTQP